jgi:hypothetical protein
MHRFLQPNPEQYCERRTSKGVRDLGFRAWRAIGKMGKGCEPRSLSVSFAS